MGWALGERAASLLHGSKKASPCFSTASAQPWWDLGLLAVTLHPVLAVPPGHSLQKYPVRCLREKATVLEKEV